MNIISVTDITKTYTERKLFEKASFYLQEREKVGVIGINGTGKSTLLKIAAGIEEPDEGQVIRANHIVVRYLPQNPAFDPEFDSREGSDYLPHNYPTHCVVYTGTHDNDTILGWMNTAPKASVKFAKEYLNLTKEEGYNWGMMRGAWASVGDLAIVPMQDIIGVGSEGRMNTPSTLGGNWEWRATADQIDNKLAKRLYKYMQMYGRVRKDVKEEAKEEA